MADERVTERLQDPLPDKDSDRFADELTAGQFNRRKHDMPSGTPEVPNIALDVIRPPSNRRIQLALYFFVLAMSLPSCGIGLYIGDHLSFGFLLVCIGGAAAALCILISIAFSLARHFSSTKHANMPLGPDAQPLDPSHPCACS